MKLTELRATFVREIVYGSGTAEVDVAPELAHGVLLDCPFCRLHSIILWFVSGVHDKTEPLKRFHALKNSIDSLTLIEDFGMPSHSEKRWSVSNGEVS